MVGVTSALPFLLADGATSVVPYCYCYFIYCQSYCGACGTCFITVVGSGLSLGRAMFH